MLAFEKVLKVFQAYLDDDPLYEVVQGVDSMTQEEYRKAAIDAVRKLSEDVGIPADLKAIVKEEDIPFLAQSAYDDACRPGNPRETSVEEIAELYKSLI